MLAGIIEGCEKSALILELAMNLFLASTSSDVFLKHLVSYLTGDTEADEEAIDLFSEYYRPTDLTDFESLFCATMPTSTRDFMPESSTDPSPFVVRVMIFVIRGKEEERDFSIPSYR